VLDGGNVVKWSDRIILTDKVVSENSGWNRKSLLAESKRLMEVERVVLIPSEPGDVTGHADGMVRFVDGGVVVVNDYRRVDREYRSKLLMTLREAGLDIIEIPYRPELGFSSGMPSAEGNYVNYLNVRSTIIMPVFGLPEDSIAQQILSTIEGKFVETLSSSPLAKNSGVLNFYTYRLKINLLFIKSSLN
jgi:agmatine deiminase